MISNSRNNVIVNLGRVEGCMPTREQLPGETYRVGNRVRVYVLELRDTGRVPQIIVSQAHPELVRELFELYVPEIEDGTVEIKSIAREAGYRTKIAVHSDDADVDPVGACIGTRGVRIQNVVAELRNEKIDVIRFSTDPVDYISNALSPARITIGSPATVNTFDREAVVTFLAERYRAERIFISAAGQVNHHDLVQQCERLFNSIAGNGKPDKVTAPSAHPNVLNQQKNLEQAHLVMGGPGLSYTDPLRYASYVMNTALGGGMSSRLFQEVREKRGRVYSIYSFMSSCVDTGYVAVYAGTNPEWVDEVIEVTLSELKKVKREGLTKPELDRAKSQIKGNMLLGMESTDSRMNRLARNEIYFRRDVPLEELAKGIESVTNDQVVELAARCFQSDQMAMVMLGDLKGRKIANDVFAPLG